MDVLLEQRLPSHSPPSTARFCSSNSSTMRCPTPRLPYMRVVRLSLHPRLLPVRQHRRLESPVLVHEASRLWGSTTTQTDKGPRYRPPRFASPTQKRRRPDCIFSELNTPARCTPFTLRHDLTVATQKLGPSGSLLLSRRLCIPASCRFIRRTELAMLRSSSLLRAVLVGLRNLQ